MTCQTLVDMPDHAPVTASLFVDLCFKKVLKKRDVSDSSHLKGGSFGVEDLFFKEDIAVSDIKI